jgi:hypothetical protein
LFDAVNFRLINDLNFEIAQFYVNFIEVLGADDVIRQGIIDVAVCQVTLFLGQPDQLLNFLGQINSGMALNRRNDRVWIS